VRCSAVSVVNVTNCVFSHTVVRIPFRWRDVRNITVSNCIIYETYALSDQDRCGG